ncbi:MAG: hypothetical protein A2V96_02855 [Candidatus Yonathbacteria bacterium RBG_16_43_6]|nr:MAG: hypothetical protein A2V96_02855 [Candidatus Yonathbacteria bacterium RBG_16_43_6]
MAQSLSSMLARGLSGQEIKRFELFLAERLKGNITSEHFIDFLDQPFKDGGLGLWKQRAIKISETVDELAHNRKKVEDVYHELERNPEVPLYEEISKMRDWLLSSYSGTLDEIGRVRFDEAVEDRIRNVISSEHFCRVLELPRKDFGVGLSMSAIRGISERLESALTGKKYQVLH